jgi:peptidoglycan/xylan/chitin deacetylase (PgdA/CDA1 family)
LILGYHGCSLTDEHEWNRELYFSPDALERRFEAIEAGGFRVLPLQEGIQRLREGTLPPRAVSLTFDDGTYDFSERVVPLLQRFGFPATVYVSTYYVEKPYPVFNTMLRYLLWKAGERVVSVPGSVMGELSLDLREPEAHRRVAMGLIHRLTDAQVPADAKEQLLCRIAAAAGIDYAALGSARLLQLMRPGEIASLPQPLVSVQLHTHRHRVPVDRARFVDEVTENRRRLASYGVAAATLVDFCYPSGVTHPSFPGWLREAGVATATTCDVALAAATDDPLLLPRFMDNGGFSQLEFEAWLSGVSQLLPRRRMLTRLAAAS